MNIAIEEVSPCRRRLRIEVPAYRVIAETVRVTDNLRQSVALRGFRAGKAPRAIIEKRYAKDIEEEVRRVLIPQAFHEALKERKLKITNALNVEEVKFLPGTSLSFSALVDLEPEFVLPEYKGLRVKKFDATVGDAEVDGAIDQLRGQMADYVTVSGRAVREGDIAVVTYEGAADGQPLVDLLPNAKHLAKNEKFWVMVREGTFLPGFAQQLVGSNAGERRTVSVTFPADFPQESLRGKAAVYDVTVDEIKETKLPEFNDEFAQQVAKVSAAELRQRVTENLQQHKEHQARGEHTRQILEQLNGASNFDVPQSSVQSQTRNLIHDIVRENELRGIGRDVLEEKKQDIFNNAQTAAAGQVKLGFILGKIAEAEKLAVTQDELVAELSRIALQQNVPVKKFVRQLRENDGIAGVSESLLNRKTIDFLLQSAIIE